LDALKRNDPSIYNEKSKFYETESESETEDKRKAEKSLTLKDYERNVVLQKGGIVNEEDEEMEELTKPAKSGKSHRVSIFFTQIRCSFEFRLKLICDNTFY